MFHNVPRSMWGYYCTNNNSTYKQVMPFVVPFYVAQDLFFLLRLLSLPFHYSRKMNIFLFRVSSPDSVVYRFQGVISSLLTLVDVIRSLLVYPNWNFEEDKETIKGVSLFLNLIFFFWVLFCVRESLYYYYFFLIFNVSLFFFFFLLFFLKSYHNFCFYIDYQLEFEFKLDLLER